MERRSGKDRRAYARSAIEVDIEWHADGERRSGTLSDLSDGGCFVLSDGDVEDGDAVRLMLPRENGQPVEVAGVVANHLIEVGFGVRFTKMRPEHAQMLREMRAAAVKS
jgi:hypothetical protein